MPLSYSVFHLKLQSNLPIPGLCASPYTEAPDVVVCLGELPGWSRDGTETPPREYYANPQCNESGVPLLRVLLLGQDYFWLKYEDGTEFIVDRAGTRVWASWPESLTVEDTVTYLLGPVVGFILRLRGVVCLHASAVAVNGQAVALLGPAGAGKSTTAAEFAKYGYPVLTDDILALIEQDGALLVRPSYPRLRLWPASVEALYGRHDALPMLTPTWDKRYLDLTEEGYTFQGGPLPLAGIYFLGERRDDPTAPFVERVSASEGLLALVGNSYTNYMLDRRMRGSEFEVLSRLLEQVPFRRVTPHADIRRLAQLCRLIVEDSQPSVGRASLVNEAGAS